MTRRPELPKRQMKVDSLLQCCWLIFFFSTPAQAFFALQVSCVSPIQKHAILKYHDIQEWQRFLLSPKATQNRMATMKISRNEINLDDDNHQEKKEVVTRIKKNFSVTVLHEDDSCIIQVEDGETILAALERQSLHIISQLDLHEMPSDCRRGNCMTCAAFLVNAPTTNIIQQQRQGTMVECEDGLSPNISNELKKLGYILTCSTTVQSDGLQIKLAQNQNVWKQMYQERLSNEETRQAARDCMARVIRQADERNVRRWARETEKVLQNTPPSLSHANDDDAM